MLSAELIADAAMQLADSGRPFGVNATARALGVTPSSLYHHVSGLDEIIELMRGRLMDRYAVDPLPEAWEGAVREIVRRQRQMYGEHPFLVPYIVGKAVADPRTLDWYDRIADVLSSAGFPDDQVLVALTAIDALGLGFGLDLAGPEAAWGTADGVEDLGRAVAAAPAGRARSEEAFEWALAMLIDGLRTRLKQAGRAAPRAGRTGPGEGDTPGGAP